jgi:hypothetical protein
MIGATSLANVGAAGAVGDWAWAVTANDANEAMAMAINAGRFMFALLLTC